MAISPKPLDGVAVLDLSAYISGPFASMMLADLGASVIKVEPPRGDPNRRIGRRLGGVGGLFLNTNRNKRSIALDLKDESDVDVLLRLVERADVVIENWRPGVAERLGLGQEVLERRNPRLVHLSIVGFGESGPIAHQGALDPLVQAMCGIHWFNKVGDVPRGMRIYLADKIASVYAVQAILGALLTREREGSFQHLTLSMLDALAYFDFVDVFLGSTLVHDPDPFDPDEMSGPKTMVTASDGYLVVAPSTGDHVRAACTALGHPEWPEQLRGMTDFRVLGPALMALLDTETRLHTTAELLDLFDRHDVPCAAVLDAEGHLAHPQVQHNEIYHEIDHPVVGPMRYARYPMRYAGVETSSACPSLDEHRQEILAELGLA